MLRASRVTLSFALRTGTEHAVEIKSNPGRHNMLNATAVLTVAHVLGLDIDAAAKGALEL